MDISSFQLPNKLVKKIINNFKNAHDGLEDEQFDGIALGGAIKVTLGHDMTAIGCSIAPEFLTEDNQELLEDALCVAINGAIEAVTERRGEVINSVTLDTMPSFEEFQSFMMDSMETHCDNPDCPICSVVRMLGGGVDGSVDMVELPPSN